MSVNIPSEDITKAITLLNEIKNQANDASSHITNLIDKVENEEINTAKGVSFLEVKFQLLLDYLINLTHVLNLKVRGNSIQNEGSVQRLVEVRTVLEKIRPIDQKLKYQIDKLIRTATTGNVAENDPLRLKPNPAGLVSKLDDSQSEDDSSDEDHVKKSGSKVYRPPKLAAVHYDGDDTVKSRTEKMLERRKKRALSSNIMKELREEIGDAPTEIQDTADMHRAKEDKAGKERTEYEEKYFLRMTVSKKELNASKKLRTIGGLDSITKFGDIRHLTATEGDAEVDGIVQKKKRKLKPGKSKKGGGKKKKRKF